MIQYKILLSLTLVGVLSAHPSWAQKAPTNVPAKPVAVATPTAPKSVTKPPVAPPASPETRLENGLTSLKTDIKITDAQKKLWDDFATSVIATQKSPEATTPAHPPGTAWTSLEKMETHQRFLKNKADGLGAIITAYKPLYDSFTNEQKAAADRLFPQRLGMVL